MSALALILLPSPVVRGGAPAPSAAVERPALSVVLKAPLLGESERAERTYCYFPCYCYRCYHHLQLYHHYNDIHSPQISVEIFPDKSKNVFLRISQVFMVKIIVAASHSCFSEPPSPLFVT